MLELKHISFQVDDGSRELGILDDVSFTLEDGRFFVITGPNGGGKSTLARIIMGIEKPTAGQILLNGRDITDLDVTERAKLGIGYAFQQPPRFKGLTVRRQAHRDRDADGARAGGRDLRRAGGGHRPVELRDARAVVQESFPRQAQERDPDLASGAHHAAGG